MSPVMKVSKVTHRNIGYIRQLCKDLPWHLRFRSHGMPPLIYRVIEQARLLFYSAIDGEDYYNLGLFRSNMPFTEKSKFLGYYKHFRYYDRINATDLVLLARDKVVFHMLAKGLDLPVPELLAVTLSKHEPGYGRRLVDEVSLENFLRENNSYDLFFKPAIGSFGNGALALGEKIPGTDLWRKLPGNTEISLSEIIEHVQIDGEMVRFLVQRRLRPHPLFHQIVPDVCSTVRIMTYTDDEAVSVLGAVLRLGNGREPTDNLSGGGVVVAIDLTTGALGAVINIDKGTPERMTAHPVSGEPITGKYIPGWRDLLDLVQAAALKLSFLPCIGWDIAVTDEGPVIVEINSRPRCRSIQVANDKGMLTGVFREVLLKHDGTLHSGLHLKNH